MGQVSVSGIDALGDDLLAKAIHDTSGCAAATVHTGRWQRQTLMALAEAATLQERGNPDATLLILRGRVRLAWERFAAEANQGDLISVPDGTHTLTALEASLLLLTVPRGD